MLSCPAEPTIRLTWVTDIPFLTRMNSERVMQPGLEAADAAVGTATSPADRTAAAAVVVMVAMMVMDLL